MKCSQFIRFITLAGLIAISWGCEKKWIGQGDSFLCVCNNPNCDRIVTEPKSDYDKLTTFTSDKAEHRFNKETTPLDKVDYDCNGIDIKIGVNKGYTKQEIIGFGTAFCDVAGRFANQKLPSELRDRIMQDYFDQHNGLAYTLGRVPIAGSDYSEGPYSYDDVEGDFDLNHWSLTKHDWEEKIPFVKRALELNPGLKLFSSPWSAPPWLKTNNQHGGLGILKGEPGSIWWKTYAKYLVKFFEAYKQQGINFWAFTTQNEPVAGLTPNWGWNALGFNGEMMRDFIKTDLGPTFEAAGLGKDNLKMIVYDDTLLAILPFVRRIGWDPEARKYISGVAYHWYDKSFHEYLSTIHYEFPDLFILGTEASEGYLTTTEPHVIHGSWVRAENYAGDIIDGLNNWAGGWTDWCFASGENGEPNWLDSPIIVNNTSPEYYRQPMYYAMGHFSKFFRPGSKRIHHETWWSNKDYEKTLKMVGAITPENEIVFNILNKEDKPVAIAFEGILEKPFKVKLEPRSLTTLIKRM